MRMTVTITMEMNHKAQSEYLAWVKAREPGRYNLASSGVVPYSVADAERERDSAKPKEPWPRLEDIELREAQARQGEASKTGPGLDGYPPLQAAIAAHCGVPTDSVVAASGTSMANFLVLGALIEPGDEVLVEEPAYEPLLAAARYFHGSVRRLKRRCDANFQLPPPGDVVSHKTKLIIITNLHNPSSVAAPEAMLRQYGEVAKGVHARVLVDEVYLECMYEKISSAFHYGPEFVVTGSLTKAYGLGGLRCGWVLADPMLAQRIWRIKDLIDPSAPHPAELLSVIAFKKLNQIGERAKTLLARNRELVRDFLRSCDRLDCALPDFGTCIFPRYKGGDTERLIDILHHRYDTDVVPGRFFEMPDHFRLGIGAETATLSAGLERLTAAMKDL
jgi:aspartate/methionine/tyrosine aminotransferase